GWELKYARRSVFPYWRSVLRIKAPLKFIPSVVSTYSREELEKTLPNLVGQGSSRIPNLKQSLLERAHQFSNLPPKRMFCSAALPLLKVLRHAGWELKYARRTFFPYWRSALEIKSPFKMIPSHVDDHSCEELENSWTKSAGRGSSRIPNLNQNLLERAHQFSNHQPKRMFCSAALPLLKVLRHALAGGMPWICFQSKFLCYLKTLELVVMVCLAACSLPS
ncbi:hypothetical protein BAE44_0020598, partial [Dichanthelium oligosanthes]